MKQSSLQPNTKPMKTYIITQKQGGHVRISSVSAPNLRDATKTDRELFFESGMHKVFTRGVNPYPIPTSVVCSDGTKWMEGIDY